MKRLAFDIGQALFQQHPNINPANLTLGIIISNLLPNLYLLAAIILFVLLIFFGLGIIMGAGEQSPEKIQKAQLGFTWAVIGFLVIFGSYWIIQIIKVVTGIDILQPRGF